MKLIWDYLKQYRGTALAFLGFAGIFAAVLSLYRLEAEAVLYALILCALLAVVLLTVRFLSFRRRRKLHAELTDSISVRIHDLPEPKTPEEQDGYDLLHALHGQLSAQIAELKAERQESLDYYTAWVHQIKTPIAVLRMELQGEDSPEHRAMLDELFRIEQYVEMVLSWQRLTGGVNDLVLREVKVDDVIRESLHKYAPLLVRRKIRMEFTPTGEKALTDEKWLGFILEQLLSNAAKYARGGTVRIACESGVLTVSDTGIGIAPEDLPRVFEKGFTGYNGRAESRATGLGLYLSKMAAERLSHSISIQSEEGKGTAVSLNLNRRSLWVE